MEAALAAADAFRIDDASCAVTQIWANIHETVFLHGHTHIYIYIYIYIYTYIPRCHGNHGKLFHIYNKRRV